MNFDLVMFYGYASLLILGALGVILSKNTVRSAMFLVMSFVMAAGTWMLIEAEFLAITLVLVYVGAVMVLFLFVVMMLDIEANQIKQSFIKQLPLALFTAGSFVYMMISILTRQLGGITLNKPLVRGSEEVSNVVSLANVLYTDYVYAFELAGMMLLVAIVAAISLTFRGRQSSKKQYPSQQVKVKKQDRLKIISMEAHKEEKVPLKPKECS